METPSFAGSGSVCSPSNTLTHSSTALPVVPQSPSPSSLPAGFCSVVLPPMPSTSPCTPVHKSSSSDHRSADLDEIRRILKEFSASPRGPDYKLALLLMTLAFLVMLGAFLGAVIFSLHLMKSQNGNPHVITSNGGRSPHAQQQFEYLGLQDLHRLPLDRLEQMQSVVMQWGGSGEERQYFYNIQSAVRDGANNSTTLNLSSDHHLIATADRAVLLDGENKEVGVLQFRQRSGGVVGERTELLFVEEDGGEEGGVEAVREGLRGGGGEDRRLGKIFGAKNDEQEYGRYPRNVVPGPPESFFDSYCRYGCGKMAVTFPYYYRPFFGYGFPLVGTQAMFPQGYGGYPGADVFAQGGVAGGPPAVGPSI